MQLLSYLTHFIQNNFDLYLQLTSIPDISSDHSREHIVECSLLQPKVYCTSQQTWHCMELHAVPGQVTCVFGVCVCMCVCMCIYIYIRYSDFALYKYDRLVIITEI